MDEISINEKIRKEIYPLAEKFARSNLCARNARREHRASADLHQRRADTQFEILMKIIRQL